MFALEQWLKALRARWFFASIVSQVRARLVKEQTVIVLIFGLETFASIKMQDEKIGD